MAYTGQTGEKSWKLWKAAILTLVGTDKRTLWTPVVGYWHIHTQHTRNWTYHYQRQEQKIANTTTHQEYKHTQSNPRTTRYTQTTPTGGRTAQGIPIQPTHMGNTLTTTDTIAKYKRIQTTSTSAEPNTVYKNLASNGSVLNGHDTFRWVKETIDNKIQEGNREVTGGLGEMNSYRTEAQGAVEILL